MKIRKVFFVFFDDYIETNINDKIIENDEKLINGETIKVYVVDSFYKPYNFYFEKLLDEMKKYGVYEDIISMLYDMFYDYAISKMKDAGFDVWVDKNNLLNLNIKINEKNFKKTT